MALLIHLFGFFASVGFLYFLEKKGISRNKRTLLAIIIGGLLGSLLQLYGNENIQLALQGYNILAVGYIRFLQMLVYPMVSLAILLAFIKIGETGGAFKPSFFILLILVGTTGIAALIGALSSSFFKLDFSSFSGILASEEVIQSVASKQSILQKPFYQFITDFISVNPFYDFTGARGSSLASIIIFLSLIGMAYLQLKKTEEIYAEKFKFSIEMLYKLMMIIVSFALKLTPYGILGLFAKLTATSQISDILKLLNFIFISYLAIFIMFLVHGIMISLVKINPISYYKKVFPVLIFGFFSRSSSAAIPLNIETQTQNLGVPMSNATVSAAFGSSVGQNGCAGIYPAMLVAILAPNFGINPLETSFLITLAVIVMINSFGIAGVGGGAIFAGIAALNAFDMPLVIIPLLAGIEPIIDMARTALNINGTIVASVVTSRVSGEMKDFK
jgi:L-cystine uptake protein TcyP (sodium:dicarboxylate symporter family)